MTAALRRFTVVGGAGFIGGHFVEHLLGKGAEQVTVYDNFSSGRRWHLADVADDPRLRVAVGEVGDLEHLLQTVAGHDTVIHLASNPDIAAAATNPAIDFDQGTALTHHVAEAARRGGVELVLYA
ncbi:MAG: UDP-glucose 4-epimerase [Acidimicrobiaceae bacterium]|nr:UDP-glucose 4-epimerase [Acidimicrobiaceae bacterium]